MNVDSLHARIQHESAELRALYPHITDCHSALVQWKEGAESQYSLRLDIRWPQHQTLISGEAKDSASGALAAGFEAARRRMGAGVKIALIQGHPDPRGGHFGHALAQAYLDAAKEAGHEMRTIDVARLDFPLLRSADEWKTGPAGDAIREAQKTIAWAEHLVIVFPLWLGDVPALLKGFFEQALRPGFAISAAAPGRMWKKLLKGRSARIVVTMGMPAFFYRLYYRSHSVKSLKRNILEFCGIAPVRTSLIGTVESNAPGAREAWLARMHAFGQAGR